MCLKIAIVDDEKSSHDYLKKLISLWSQKEHIVVTCDDYENGDAFIHTFKNKQYDIVFMDIFMDQYDGIETAAALRKHDAACIVIFLTSSTEHMPDAFSCHAFDYIVKPAKPEKLYKVLCEALVTIPNKQLYINLPIGKQTVPVLYSDIIYILADSNYCLIRSKEEYRCRISFSAIKEGLEKDQRFCVINRGILVNLDHVLNMEGLTCRMKNGITFPLNTKKKLHLNQQLTEHRFARRVSGICIGGI